VVGAPLVPWLSESVVADVAALHLEGGPAATRRAPGGVGASHLGSHTEMILVFGLADNDWSGWSLLWLAKSLILQLPDAFQTLETLALQDGGGVLLELSFLGGELAHLDGLGGDGLHWGHLDRLCVGASGRGPFEDIESVDTLVLASWGGLPVAAVLAGEALIALREVVERLEGLQPLEGLPAGLAAAADDLVAVSAPAKVANESAVKPVALEGDFVPLVAVLALADSAAVEAVSAEEVGLSIVSALLPFVILHGLRALAVAAGGLNQFTALFTLLRLAEAHHFEEVRLVLVCGSLACVTFTVHLFFKEEFNFELG